VATAFSSGLFSLQHYAGISVMLELALLYNKQCLIYELTQHLVKNKSEVDFISYQ
jgi:hypothetical protein